MIMSKPEISSKFDVDDIRKIHEYNSLRHIHMTQEEIVADTKAGAADLLELWNREPIRHLGIHTGRVKRYILSSCDPWAVPRHACCCFRV